MLFNNSFTKAVNEMKEHLNIPINILVYALRYSKTSQVRLFIYLKLKYDSHFHLSPELIAQSSRDLNICERTFRNHLKWLTDKKWITVVSRTKKHRIKSFDNLNSQIKEYTTYGAICEDTDVPKFKIYTAAAVITYFMIYIWQGSLNREYPVLKIRSAYVRYHKASVPYVLPNSYLAKVVKCSKSTASVWRKNAVQQGYLVVKRRFDSIDDKGFPKYYKKYCSDELKPRIREIQGLLFSQEADEIVSNVKLRRRRRKKSGKRKRLKMQKIEPNI